MHNPKTRSIVLLTSATIGIGAMILLAVALAQRDARLENKLANQPLQDYPLRKAQGIVIAPDWEERGWPPAPIIRGNDSLSSSSASSQARQTDTRNPFRSPASVLVAFANPPKERTGRLAEPPSVNYKPLPSQSRGLMPLPSSNPSVPNGAGLSSNSNSNVAIPNNPSPRSPQANNVGISGGASLGLPTLPVDNSAGVPSSTNLMSPNGSVPNVRPSNSLRSAPSLVGGDSDDQLLNPNMMPVPPSREMSSRLSDVESLNSDLSSARPATGALGSRSPAPSAAAPPASPFQPFPSSTNNTTDSPSSLPAPSSFPAEVRSPTGYKELPSNTGPDALSEQQPTATVRMQTPVPSESSLSEIPTAQAPSPMPRAQSISPSQTARSNNIPKSPSATLPVVSLDDSPPNQNVSGPGSFKALTSPSPGVRQLEGAQNPNIEIQKRAPSEVQVGLPATISLIVRNVGNATAFDVNVTDTVPKGTKLTRTEPKAKVDNNGNLLWELGQFKAGAEQALTMEIIPETEGEIGSVASVQFAAQASVRTMSTLPKLVVKQTAASSVLGGDSEIIHIEVVNNGTGTARNVRLEAEIPPNMRHASGSSALDTDSVDLAPGESFQMDLELDAVGSGQATSKIRAVADNAATFESTATIQVIQPRLELAIEGPRLRYLERQATYKIHVQNTGTALARGIRLTLYLPRGMEFNSAANEGTYFADQHAVEWLLEELGAGKSATTELAVLPVQEGEFVLRMHGTAERVRADAIDKKVQVEGQSELAFSVEDENDPIEKDGQTTYIIRVTNSGTRPDNDVQLIVELPDGASVDQVHAPVNHQVSGRQVSFAPMNQLQPRDQQVYRLAIRHSREGIHVLKAQLKSRNRPIAVTKEESTQVYTDQ